MNYCNYEVKIVKKYGVELEGWPTGKSGICNPATLSGWPQLEKLLLALESGQCQWVVLSDDELKGRKKQNQVCEECGEQVYHPHKSANHHGNSKGLKSAETIEESEEEGDNKPTTKQAGNDDEDSDEDEQEPAMKQTQNSKKSAETIETSKEGDNEPATKRAHDDKEDLDEGEQHATKRTCLDEDRDNSEDNTPASISVSDNQDNGDNMAIHNTRDNATT